MVIIYIQFDGFEVVRCAIRLFIYQESVAPHLWVRSKVLASALTNKTRRFR